MEIDVKCLVCGASAELVDGNEPRICLKHWKCPKCGVSTEYTDENDYGVEIEGLIYDEGDDHAHCGKCNKSWSYRGIERAIVKKNNMITCPFCKGRGTVSNPFCKGRRTVSNKKDVNFKEKK